MEQLLTTSHQTVMHEVLLLSDITNSPCSEIRIAVSGYNGLNGGTNSIPNMYLPSGDAQLIFF